MLVSEINSRKGILNNSQMKMALQEILLDINVFRKARAGFTGDGDKVGWE